jgi:iron complex outermembrane recepter protein
MKFIPRSPRLSPLAAAVALACTGTSLLLPSYSAAQQPAAAQEQADEEITITGSRIQRTSGFTTPVPVTAVTLDDLESFKPGATMADQLDQLPQFFQTQSAQRGGGALFGGAGRSVVDLRAMGPARTLILLDGARLAPADRDGSVHIDNIPTALLSQVEVVTGGASAAYGADALAGVTNFRLNRTYEGMDVSVGTGATADGMGDNRNLSWAYGNSLGENGHVIASVEHHRIDPIEYDPTELGDWFQRYGIVENPAWAAVPAGPNQASIRATMPARLVLPNVYSRNHAPTGRIGLGRSVTNTPATFALTGQVFTDDGTGIRPFSTTNAIVGAATGNQSGGTDVINGMTEAQRANRAFNGGPYGAEVERTNAFLGYTFDANDTTRYFVNLLAGRTQSNDQDQRGIPHMASPWTTRIFVDNAYLPTAVRAAMRAQNVDSFVMEKQGTWLGQSGNWGDSEDRHNQFDSWTLQLGLDKDIGDNWQMQARIQRGATDRLSQVFNEIRVDREMLAIDAVEVYNDRRDLTNDAGTGGPDGRPDLITDALRGTGTIICNVQRYNPTAAQLQQAVQNIRVPAAQGDSSLGNGDPTFPVPIPSPVGPDAIPNCVPMNILGQGNVSQAAQDYVVSEKSGIGAVTQEFAEILFNGDIWEGYGPGAFSMAVGATWREQWFWQAGLPVDLMRYGPPVNADGLPNPAATSNPINLGIRGIQGGFTTGSPNLHEFSTVPTISGGYDVWETFAELSMPLWETESGRRALEINVAGRYSEYSTSGGINSNKLGVNLKIAEFLRFRTTASRDVREPTFAERFDVQGGGGSIQEHAINNVPTPDGLPRPGSSLTTFQITSTALGNPGLSPEEADTITAGFVVEPVSTGLQFSIDWYDIDLAGAIGQLGVQRIVNECNLDPANSLCQYVFRDPGTRAVTAVRNPWLNINNARVRGLDYELLWNRDLDLLGSESESLTVRFLAGRLLEDSTTTPGGLPTDLAGQLAEPENRALLSARYRFGDFGVGWQQRYIGESEINGGAITFVQFQPGLIPSGTQATIDDSTVDAKSYTDLTFFWNREMADGQNWELSLSLTNAFDEDPPVIPAFDQRFSSQGNPANSYDVYGRRWLLGLRVRL